MHLCVHTFLIKNFKKDCTPVHIILGMFKIWYFHCGRLLGKNTKQMDSDERLVNIKFVNQEMFNNMSKEFYANEIKIFHDHWRNIFKKEKKIIKNNAPSLKKMKK